MHDDLCQVQAENKHNRYTLHCWREPQHPGDHYDRAFGVWWRPAPTLVREPRKPGPFRRPQVAAVA